MSASRRSVNVSVSASVCNLTHSGVVVGQRFSQLTSSQKFAAHLQVVLSLGLRGPQDPCNVTLYLSVISNILLRKIAAADHGVASCCLSACFQKNCVLNKSEC